MAQSGVDTYGRPEALLTPVVDDNGSQTVKQILAKQDEILDMLAVLTAKMDADSGGGGETDYADLTTDLIEKVKFIG